MAVIKIPNVNDTTTFHVVKCEVVESPNITDPKTGQPQEQVKFTAPNGDTLFVGREPADRALTRLGFADGEQVLYGDVDGWTLRFYRVANKNPAYKPYFNIDKVTDGDHAPSPTPTAAPQKAPAATESAPVARTGLASLADRLAAVDTAYLHAYQTAARVQGDESSTPDSLQAGAATLLIAYDKQGLIAHFLPEQKAAPAPAPAKPKGSTRPPVRGAPDDFDAPLPDEPDMSDDLPFS